MGGDLNFTLTAREIWGDRARLDPLDDTLTDMFVASRLVDMVPNQMTPTWRNGRVGSQGVTKRIDRFIMNNNLLA